MKHILGHLNTLYGFAIELRTLVRSIGSAGSMTDDGLVKITAVEDSIKYQIEAVIEPLEKLWEKARRRETLTLSAAYFVLEEIDWGLSTAFDERIISNKLMKYEKEIRWAYLHLIPQIERSDENYELIHSTWVFAVVFLLKLARTKRYARHLELFDSYKAQHINSAELGFMAGKLMGYAREAADDFHFITSDEFNALIKNIETVNGRLDEIFVLTRRLTSIRTPFSINVESLRYVVDKTNLLVDLLQDIRNKVEAYINQGPRSLEAVLKPPFRHVDRQVGVRRKKRRQNKRQRLSPTHAIKTSRPSS